MFRIIWINCLVVFGCSKPVTFQEDTAIWVIAPAQSRSPPAQPQSPAPRAAVGEDAIVVSGNLEFGENATISPASLAVLNEVASLSRSNPDVKKIVVEKLRLSQPQTTAVLAYLVQQGVAADVAISCAPDPAPAMTPVSPGLQPATDDDDEASAHAD